MLRLSFLSLLLAAAADAHVTDFEFVAPKGAHNRTGGGPGFFQWVDGADPLNLVGLSFFARRPALSPWDNLSTLDGGLEVNAVEIPVSDPSDVYLWDTTGVEPGCYQAVAILHDQIEGAVVYPGLGHVVVDSTDGGNQPPSIWVTNDAAQTVNADGTWTVQFEVDDPDDATRVSLWHVSTTTQQAVEFAHDLPVQRGGGAQTFALDTRQLAPGFYAVHAVVVAPDSATCDAWSAGYINVAESDGGLDGGTLDASVEVDSGVADAGAGVIDAGTPGGGLSDAGADAGSVPRTPLAPPDGCGCSTAGSPMWVCLCSWLLCRRCNLRKRPKFR